MSETIQIAILYEFTLGTRAWRYSSTTKDVIDENSIRWTAVAISDDGVKQTGEAVVDALSVRAPSSIAPAQLFMLSPPSRTMWLRVYEATYVTQPIDMGDTGVLSTVDDGTLTVSNKRVSYVGEVVQAAPNPAQVVFTVETLSASMRREGLHLGWQRQCPYAVYDPTTCKLNKAAYAVNVTVAVIAGLTITVTGATLASDAYNAGMIEFIHPVKGIETLTIEQQTGNDLLIFGLTDDLWVGMALTIYRGCDQTPDTCQSLNNYLNYGGVPNMPGKSPFDGDPVF